MADVEAREAKLKAEAEEEFKDARFRLGQAERRSDWKRVASEAALMSRLIPDIDHPYRVRLETYRETIKRKLEAER